MATDPQPTDTPPTDTPPTDTPPTDTQPTGGWPPELAAPPELTRHTAARFGADLLAAARLAAAPGHVTADLRATDLLDAAGVGTLLAAARALERGGGHLSVRLAPGGQPERLFQRMCLGRVMARLDESTPGGG